MMPTLRVPAEFRERPELLREDLARLTDGLEEYAEALGEAVEQRPAATPIARGTGSMIAVVAKFGELLRVNPIGGNLLVQLPPIDPNNTCRRLRILRLNAANTVTLQPVRGRINGATSMVLAPVVGVHEIWCDGESYFYYSPASTETPPATSTGGLATAVVDHVVTGDTAALWQFDDDLTDSGPNGITLSQDGTATRFCRMPGGRPALHIVDNIQAFTAAGDQVPLKIVGDLTIQCFVQFQHVGYPSAAEFISYGGTGTVLYAIGFRGPANYDTFFFQAGNIEVSASLPPLFDWGHYSIRRLSGVWQQFWNGKPFGPATAAMTDPVESASINFVLGDIDNTSSMPCEIRSLRICNTGRSNATILADYNATLGPWLGERS